MCIHFLYFVPLPTSPLSDTAQAQADADVDSLKSQLPQLEEKLEKERRKCDLFPCLLYHLAPLISCLILSLSLSLYRSISPYLGQLRLGRRSQLCVLLL